jgi:hypothetical protein
VFGKIPFTRTTLVAGLQLVSLTLRPWQFNIMYANGKDRTRLPNLVWIDIGPALPCTVYYSTDAEARVLYGTLMNPSFHQCWHATEPNHLVLHSTVDLQSLQVLHSR